MLERNFAGVLVEIGKDFHEHDLSQIFFAEPPRQMGAHNLDHQRVQAAHQLPCRVFVLLSDPRQAQRQLGLRLRPGTLRQHRRSYGR